MNNIVGGILSDIVNYIHSFPISNRVLTSSRIVIDKLGTISKTLNTSKIIWNSNRYKRRCIIECISANSITE